MFVVDINLTQINPYKTKTFQGGRFNPTGWRGPGWLCGGLHCLWGQAEGRWQWYRMWNNDVVWIVLAEPTWLIYERGFYLRNSSGERRWSSIHNHQQQWINYNLFLKSFMKMLKKLFSKSFLLILTILTSISISRWILNLLTQSHPCSRTEATWRSSQAPPGTSPTIWTGKSSSSLLGTNHYHEFLKRHTWIESYILIYDWFIDKVNQDVFGSRLFSRWAGRKGKTHISGTSNFPFQKNYDTVD